MYFKIFLFVLLCSSEASAQNWNVFNKTFRYNYKFNNSAVVTNVLFVDTIKQLGTDTVYSLNRIGVHCISNCMNDTLPFSQHPFYYGNMPQFLQRSILKYSTGLVQLFDTTKIIIIPTCTLNQTWLFDSVYSKNATCIDISTQTIFGFTDSVKTILINNVDTVKISKLFGLTVFPELYGKNKYYRLSGIEHNNTYDSTPLYGERVPNAWDFYNFNVGDVFCKLISSHWNSNGQFTVEKNILTGKNILPNGFSYSYNCYSYQISGNYLSSLLCASPQANTFTLTSKSISYINLSSTSLIENRMYPKMIYIPQLVTTTIATADQIFSLPDPNICNYGKDNNGKFYKQMGDLCSTYSNPIMPNQNSLSGLNLISPSYYKKSNSEQSRLCFGEAFGLVNFLSINFESGYTNHLTSVTRNGITYFDQPNTIGIEKNTLNFTTGLIYPNPAQKEIFISITEPTEIAFMNSLGQTVYSITSQPGEKIDISDLNAGIYLVYMKSTTISRIQKVVVQH